jgi:hypothetical protein
VGSDLNASGEERSDSSADDGGCRRRSEEYDTAVAADGCCESRVGSIQRSFAASHLLPVGQDRWRPSPAASTAAGLEVYHTPVATRLAYCARYRPSAAAADIKSS